MDQGKRNKGHREKRRSRSESPVGQSTSQIVCDFVGNAAIVAILFVAPLIMGGRHPVGKLVYLGLVGALAFVWLVRQSLTDKAVYRPNGIGWLLGAAIALVVLQLAPLPSNIIDALSPFQSNLLPMWSETATPSSLGTWNRVSLAPFSTREGLVTLLTHITLFTVAVQWLRDWKQVERLLRLVALATITMAAIGFAQYLSHTSKFAWVFTHPSRDASRVLCGPFANSNHFSHFLALGIGPVLWWLHEALQARGNNRNRPAQMYGQYGRNPLDNIHLVLIVGLALIATGGLLAQSRGGMLVMFTSATLGVALFAMQGILGAKSFAAIFTAGLFVAVALGIHGKEEVASELATMTSLESIDKSESRRNIWRANLRAAKKFSVCGAGVGAHDEVYRRFYPHPSEVEYTHAESGFLQVLTETGLPGFGIVLMCVGACARWLWILSRHIPSDRVGMLIAVTVSLVASGVHSVFDFVWFLPACMSLTILVAAAACRMSQLAIDEFDQRVSPAEAESYDGLNELLKTIAATPDESNDQTSPEPPPALRPTSTSFSKPAWLAFAAAVLAMFVSLGSWQWPVAHASLSWNRYLRLSLAKTPPRTIVEEASESPEEKSKRIENERERNRQKRDEMVRELETTLERFPNHPRANLRLAGFKIRLFEEAQASSQNAMPLDQIRDAAYASLDVAPEKVDRWLTTALGENRKIIQDVLHRARTGVMNSPLMGNGYMLLSQVAFLDGQTKPTATQLVEQAFAVRPYDGNIWLSIGESAFLKGDLNTAFHFRRKAFHQDAECREAIINGLAGRMPVTTFLQQFEPDESGLRSLLRFYTVHQQEENTRVVAGFLGDHAVERAQEAQGESAAAQWVRATLLYRMSGDTRQTLSCASTAAAAAPNSLRVRRMYAKELVRQQHWAAAIPELRWCINRSPGDQQAKQMLATATRTAHWDSRDQDNTPRSR